LAVVGLQETLEALANGQVEELLISGALEESHPQLEEVQAILAPELPDSEGGTKSEDPRQASLPDLLVTKAKQSGATVTLSKTRPCSNRSAVSPRSCDGASKLAIGLLMQKHVQDH